MWNFKHPVTLTFLLILFLIGNAYTSWSQVTFSVKEFSKDYYGKVYISDTNKVFSEGWIAIYEFSDHTEIIKIEAEELTYELIEDSIVANILEIPYGEQSNIIYEDFNFDGIKDFAIMDGYYSCYHGPSFQIFIKEGNEFIFNQRFTDLAQNYCGMFYADPELKIIETMTKSGCCWHQYSTFKVKNNIPYPIEIIEIDHTGIGFTTLISTEQLINGQMIKEEIQKIDSFKVDKKLYDLKLNNGKSMSIYHFDDQLIYFFENTKQEVELCFYDHFIWSPKRENLNFVNDGYQYTINNEGISIQKNNQNFFLPAIHHEGDLNKTFENEWSNVELSFE